MPSTTPKVVPAQDPRRTSNNEQSVSSKPENRTVAPTTRTMGPKAGATAGKSGAVMPAMSSAAVQDQIASGQVKRAGSPTGTNTKGVSTKGSTDLSSGDLTSILNLANQSEAHIADAYNQGAQAQAAIDAGAVTSSSTTSGGLSGLLSQPYTKWIIAAGVVIGGYVIYQRRKSGTPTFPNSGGGNDASF